VKYYKRKGFICHIRFYELLAFLLFTSLLYNCSKEDSQDPLIEIVEPSSFLTISAGDSIYLEVNVSDDNYLDQVSIQLLDENQVSVSPSLVYHPNNKRFHISILYPVSNIYLESGTYLLGIFAFDGKNTSRKAVELRIEAIPLERKKVYALNANASSLTLYSLDTAQAYSTVTTVTGDFLASSIDSRNERISILGRSDADYSILDANNGNLLYQISGLCPIASPCFEYLQFQEGLNFISYNDGNIKAFDSNGLQKFAIQQQGYFRPGASYLSEEYFFAELYYIAQQELRLGTFFYPSGAIRQEFVLDLKILQIFNRAQDEIYLFGHSSGNAVVETFNRQFNRTFPLRNFGAMIIYSVYEFSANNFYLCTNQGIWNFNALQNQITQIQINPAQEIKYDPVYNEFFVAEQNKVRVIDASSFQEKKVYQLPDSVQSILLFYNK